MVSNRVDWAAREQQVFEALPGEVDDIQRRTKLPVSAVRSCLNRLVAAGVIGKRTSWISQHAYRWVYFVPTEKPKEVKPLHRGHHKKKELRGE